MSVAIVGAGPAGSTLALLLARHDVPVTLLDRAEWPRPKPCGDCLSAESGALLGRLGLLADVEAAGPARLEGWRIVAPGGHAFAARFDELDDPLSCALALRRVHLDAILLDAARRAGADVRTGHTVSAIESGPAPRIDGRGPDGPFTLGAALVVGADGLRSIVARRLAGPRRRARVRKVSLTAHIRDVSLPDALGEMHLATDLCAGLAPAGGGVYNLTLVADSDRFGRAIARDARGFFTDAVPRFPLLPDRLRRTDLTGDDVHLLASGPFDVPVRNVTGPGWALVGDAAGYFDPFTGQGIFQALRGAELLAEAVLAALAAPRHTEAAFARYARAHRRLTGPTRLLQHVIDAVLRSPARADRVIHRLARAPRVAGALLAATADARPPSSLLSPGLLLSFAVPRPRSSA